MQTDNSLSIYFQCKRRANISGPHNHNIIEIVLQIGTIHIANANFAQRLPLNIVATRVLDLLDKLI